TSLLDDHGASLILLFPASYPWCHTRSGAGTMALLLPKPLGRQECGRAGDAPAPRRQGWLYACAPERFEVRQTRRPGHPLLPQPRAPEKTRRRVATGDCPGSISRRLLERSALA